MYTAHFRLTEPPFSITPDPRYFYMSEGHREALAHLLYGIGEGGGFVQLTGEIGTGKTTLCRCLLEQLPPQVDVALILNPRLTDTELLATVCDELGIEYPAGTTSLKLLVDALYRYLLDAHTRGRRTVLIVDEAQDLALEVLEQIRLLTNLETPTRKLLQIILIGQPELIRSLDRPQLRQLAQRVTARYHLLPFSEEDTCAYIQHRLQVAGQRKRLFSDAAAREVHRESGGVPRLINAICDRALLAAYTRDEHRVDAAVVGSAAREVLGGTAKPRRARALRWASALAVAGVVVSGAWVFLTYGQVKMISRGPTQEAKAPAAAPSAAPSPAVTPVPSPPASSAAAPAPADGKTAAAPSEARPAPSAVKPPEPRTVRTPDSAAPDFKTVKLSELLSDRALKSDMKAAFGSLYARWRLDYDSTKNTLGCERGRPEGLRCLFKTGTWAKLRRFNLPAIIELVSPTGDRHYATVTALDEQTVTLDFGPRQVTFPLSEVDPFWEGSFILLWKPPALSAPSIAPGARGKDVEWLRQRLSELDGKPPAGKSRDVFDDELRARVMAFQRSRALVPDGVVGEETLSQLATALRDPRVPRLSRSGS